MNVVTAGKTKQTNSVRSAVDVYDIATCFFMFQCLSKNILSCGCLNYFLWWNWRMVRKREKKMPTESLLNLMVLYTVVNFEWCSRTLIVQLCRQVWNLECPQHVGHWKSEQTKMLWVFILFFFFFSQSWICGGREGGVPTTVCTQQLIQHSFSVSKRSQELQAGRQLQTAPGTTEPSVFIQLSAEQLGGVGTCSGQSATRLHGSPAWNGKWAENCGRRLTATVSKRGEHDAAGTPTGKRSLSEWVSEAGRHNGIPWNVWMHSSQRASVWITFQPSAALKEQSASMN